MAREEKISNVKCIRSYLHRLFAFFIIFHATAAAWNLLNRLAKRLYENSNTRQWLSLWNINGAYAINNFYFIHVNTRVTHCF